jgi:hypothetical protein
MVSEINKNTVALNRKTPPGGGVFPPINQKPKL